MLCKIRLIYSISCHAVMLHCHLMWICENCTKIQLSIHMIQHVLPFVKHRGLQISLAAETVGYEME